MAVIIGIDLGTTFSAVAVVDETGHPRIVHNKDGQNVTASCVSEQDGVIEVGEYARRTWGERPDAAAARFKRNMGTSQKYSVNGQAFTPTELSTLVLKKLIKDAQDQVGKIDEAVITIPANYSHEAREATMAAAKAAGLSVRHIINEPTAAALYYAFKSGTELDGIYAVYDIGGGTFDVSIIRAKGHAIEVLSSNGVAKLGGDDFDSALITLVVKKYRAVTGNDLPNGVLSKNLAEDLKKTLSSRLKTSIKIENSTIELSRSEFEDAISSLIAQAEMLCETTMDEAKVQAADIKGVFLVGGSSRIPMVHWSVKKTFGQEPKSTINVDEVVALGAALYAAYKGDRKILTPTQAKTIEKISVAETTSRCFGTIILNRDNSREQKRMENSVLISKGDKIPCSITRSFYTVFENQQAVNCQVTESISAETDPKFVKVVWEGDLELPPNRPSGQEIKVTFSYDQNQIMKCSFVDVSTGRLTTVDLSLAAASDIDKNKMNKFLVE